MNEDLYPFMQLRAGSENVSSDILFISMYTEKYAPLAQRLAHSMTKHGLPFAVYEVPTVHNSISEKGSADLNYTKSSFIRYVMNKTGKKIVYIDCDCEIIKFPSLIFEICHNYDFAVYNWLSSEQNDVYLPYKALQESNLFYKYSHSIQPTCESQLICSGAVQFWSNNEKSNKLLAYWQNTIENNPGSADDYCLDFSFNNFNKIYSDHISCFWLPKAYARYAWWIFDEPVIDHPQIPNLTTKWKDVTDSEERQRFYADEFDSNSKKVSTQNYPGIIDPYMKIHINQLNDGSIKVDKLTKKIWIREG